MSGNDLLKYRNNLRQFISTYLPENRWVNSKIVMGKKISSPAHLTPGQGRQHPLSLRGNIFSRFTNDFNTPLEQQLGLNIALQILKGYGGCCLSRYSCVGQHVL